MFVFTFEYRNLISPNSQVACARQNLRQKKKKKNGYINNQD